MARAKILIVENEPNMILGLKDNLEFEQCVVAVATDDVFVKATVFQSFAISSSVYFWPHLKRLASRDGQEGLNKILDESFDLILLDVMMPKMSGFDVCKYVRKQGIVTSIIFLTTTGE